MPSCAEGVSKAGWTEPIQVGDYDGDYERSKQKSLQEDKRQSKKRNSESNRMNSSYEEEDNSGSFDKPLGASTAGQAAVSSLQANLAEKTAAEMKQIIDWYSSPQRQNLVDNALFSIDQTYGEDDCKQHAISLFTATVEPKDSAAFQTLGTLDQGDYSEVTHQKSAFDHLLSETQAMAEMLSLLNSPQIAGAERNLCSPQIAGAERNLCDEARQQHCEVNHLSNQTKYMAGVIAELQQTSDSDDEQYAAANKKMLVGISDAVATSTLIYGGSLASPVRAVRGRKILRRQEVRLRSTLKRHLGARNALLLSMIVLLGLVWFVLVWIGRVRDSFQSSPLPLGDPIAPSFDSSEL
jgi:hypothetical protein